MLTEFNIINPVQSRKSPFYNKKKGLFYFPTTIGYRYYLECTKFNTEKQDTEFYILLGKIKFNENCKQCHVDNYGRCQIRPAGILKDYILEEIKERGNFIMDYIESKNDYDIYNLI